MQLQLVHTNVKNMVFRESELKEDGDNSLEFRIGTSWDPEKDKQQFTISFDMTIEDSSGYELELEYQGTFDTNEDIDAEFLASQWALVNAPAIVYPFMRAFISNMTINAGKSPAIIPAVNFQQMYRDDLDKKLNKTEIETEIETENSAEK